MSNLLSVPNGVNYKVYPIFILLIVVLTSYSQSLDWVTSYDDNSYTRVSDIISDSEGNIYSTGYFELSTDFDPGDNELILESYSGSSDIYIQKLNALGDLEWAYSFGSSSYDAGNSIAIDEYNNVYLAGQFKEGIDFDPGDETFYLHSNGESDAFIIKIDPNGSLIWAISFGSESGYESCNGINVDIDGNIICTGRFYGTIDFDPGSPTYNLTSNGQSDSYILKLNSDGNFIWAKNIGGTGYDKGKSIYFDHQGNIYTTGQFENLMEIDLISSTITLNSNGDKDIFIIKQSPTGEFLFAVAMGGIDEDLPYSIIVDDNNNIYSTGYFYETVDFNPGIEVDNHTSNGGKDIYIQKLDPSGNYIWTKYIGGAYHDDHAFEIAIDEYNNIYTAGYFKYTVDFDPGPDEFNLTSSEWGSAFVLKLGPSGNLDYVFSTEGNDSEIARAIHISKVGVMYVTGDYDGTVDFDPGPNTQTLNGSEDGYAYIQKFDYLNNISSSTSGGFFKLVTNPVNETLKLNIEKSSLKNIKIIIRSIENKVLFEKVYSNSKHISIDMSKFSRGLYFVSLINDGSTYTTKFIKQ